LTALHNPFLSLPLGFAAKPARDIADAKTEMEADEPIPLNPVGEEMFRTGPEDIKPEWLSGNKRFCAGIERIGGILNGGR
jgi:hypothetical protein